jgi:NADH dehydrogenase
VDVVIHLAATIRDQAGGTIEQVSGTATATLVDAAVQAGVRRFVFFSTLEASAQSPSRFFRAKAVAEEAVRAAALETIVFAPSIIYAPDDPFMTLLRRLARIPGVMPIAGAGQAAYQPIWSEDVADCVVATLDWDVSRGDRFELAGPQTLTYEQIVALVLRAAGKRRAFVHVPMPLVYRSLAMLERLAGRHAFATGDEAELMEIPLISEHGTRDPERLGVRPATMEQVLGLA